MSEEKLTAQLDPANHHTAADLLEPTPAAQPPQTDLPPAIPAIKPLPPSSSITDLRARLHDKLDGFRRDRGIDDSDPQSRDALEAEQRRRRGEMRDKRRNLRKEERRKERDEPTAKPAKVRDCPLQVLLDTDVTGPTHRAPAAIAKRGFRLVPLRLLTFHLEIQSPSETPFQSGPSAGASGKAQCEISRNDAGTAQRG